MTEGLSVPREPIPEREQVEENFIEIDLMTCFLLMQVGSKQRDGKFDRLIESGAEWVKRFL